MAVRFYISPIVDIPHPFFDVYVGSVIEEIDTANGLKPLSRHNIIKIGGQFMLVRIDTTDFTLYDADSRLIPLPIKKMSQDLTLPEKTAISNWLISKGIALTALKTMQDVIDVLCNAIIPGKTSSVITKVGD